MFCGLKSRESRVVGSISWTVLHVLYADIRQLDESQTAENVMVFMKELRLIGWDIPLPASAEPSIKLYAVTV